MQTSSPRLKEVPVPDAVHTTSQVHLQHRPEEKGFAQLRLELVQMQRSQKPQHLPQHAQQEQQAFPLVEQGWGLVLASLVRSVEPSVRALPTHFTGGQLLDFAAQLSRVVKQGTTQLTAADREAVCCLLRAVASPVMLETWLVPEHAPFARSQVTGLGMGYSTEFGCSQVVIALHMLVLMRCDAAHLFGPCFGVIAELKLGQARLDRAAQSLAVRDALQLDLQPVIEQLGEAHHLENPTIDSVSAAAVQAGDAAIDAEG